MVRQDVLISPLPCIVGNAFSADIGKALTASIDRYTGIKLGSAKENNASYEAFDDWSERFCKLLVGVNSK